MKRHRQVLAASIALLIAFATLAAPSPAQVRRRSNPQTAPATPGARIFGHVLDIDGKPVYRAIVMPTPAPGNTTRSTHRATSTGPDGAFQLQGLEGDYLLRAIDPDYRATRTATRVTAGADEVQLVIEKDVAPMLKGRVLDAEGKPIHIPPAPGFGGGRGQVLMPSGAVRVAVAVELVPGSGNYAVVVLGPKEPPTFTDDDGNYSVHAFFPDLRWCVIAQAQGYAPARSPLKGPFTPGGVEQLDDITLRKR